jgi:hypothetical protein
MMKQGMKLTEEQYRQILELLSKQQENAMSYAKLTTFFIAAIHVYATYDKLNTLCNVFIWQ